MPPTNYTGEALHHVTDLRTVQLLKGRFALAENGQWDTLIADATADRASQASMAATGERSTIDRMCADEQSPAAFAKRAQHAVTKVRSGCVRSAMQILTGQGKAPNDTRTLAMITELVGEDATCTERAATAAAAHHARQNGLGHVTCKLRTVRRKGRTLRAGAEPGPSGWRNSHLLTILRREGGPAAVAGWCRLWTSGGLPPCVTELWTQAVIVPLRKPDEKVRPIALGECLLKFCEGVVVDECSDKLRSMLEPSQLAVRTPGGAELLTHVVRSWTDEYPDMALLQIDLRNAYGRAHRSSMLRAASQHAPAVATLMASQWHGANIAWAQANGHWTPIPTYRGGWQGSAAMPVAFALALEVCLRAVTGSPARMQAQAPTSTSDAPAVTNVARIGYADDQFLHGRPEELLRLWDPLVAALAAEGHSVQPAKCHAWCPSLEAPGRHNASYDNLCAPLQRDRGGMQLLGTVANGEHSQHVGAPAGGNPIIMRAEAAASAGRALLAMLSTPVSVPVIQVVWTLLQKSVARALDYDMRLQYSAEASVAASNLDSTVLAVFSALTGGDVRARERDLAALPGPLGGCSLRAATFMHASAFTASWMHHRHHAIKYAQLLGRVIGEVHGKTNVVRGCG